MKRKTKRQANIIDLYETRQYKRRAYMSYALTGLEPNTYKELTDLAEELCVEVFDKLGVLLYLPHLWSAPGHHKDMTPEDVHILDRLRISQADFMVLCANQPSFGVGQEYEIAQAMGLQVIMFRRADPEISRMLRGAPANYVKPGTDPMVPSSGLLVYDNPEKLKEQLEGRVVNLLSQLPNSKPIFGSNFGDNLRRAMKEKRVTKQQLARKTGMTTAFLDLLSASDEDLNALFKRNTTLKKLGACDVNQYINAGAWVVARVGTALNVPVSRLIDAATVSSDEAQRAAKAAKILDAAHPFLCAKNARIATFFEKINSDPAITALAARSGNLEAELERVWSTTAEA
jgi:hypothetical protein